VSEFESQSKCCRILSIFHKSKNNRIDSKTGLCGFQMQVSLWTSEISVTETITETEIIDPTLTETETETIVILKTEIL